MTDRLTLTRAFEGAGLKSDDAERIATEIYNAIHDNVATKADLDGVKIELKADLRELELRLDVRFAQIDTRFEAVAKQIDRVVVRLGALVVVVVTVLFAALHYWPPHG